MTPWILLGIALAWATIVIRRPRGPMPDSETHRSYGGYGGPYGDWEKR